MSSSTTSSLSGLLDDFVEMGLRAGLDALDLLSGRPVSDCAGAFRQGGLGALGPRPVAALLPLRLRDPAPVLDASRAPAGRQPRLPGSNCEARPLRRELCRRGPLRLGDRFGPDAGLVTVTPANLTIAPFEHGLFTATMSVPPGADHHWRAHVLLWVHGCREHVVRWEVRTDERGCGTHHEVRVEDCPDYVHHWYDHFYCERPCGAAVEHG